ncbi:MAG: hypothetical protein RJB55_1762 [Verrucomicrobiota bacterium]
MREAGYGEMAGVNLEIRKSGFDVTNPENAARCAHGTRGKRGRWNHSCAFASLRGSRFAKRFLESVLLIRAIRGELRGVRDGLTPSPGPRRTNRRRRRPSQPRHGPRRAAAATPSPPLSVCHRVDPWLPTRGAVRKRERFTTEAQRHRGETNPGVRKSGFRHKEARKRLRVRPRNTRKTRKVESFVRICVPSWFMLREAVLGERSSNPRHPRNPR